MPCAPRPAELEARWAFRDGVQECNIDNAVSPRYHVVGIGLGTWFDCMGTIVGIAAPGTPRDRDGARDGSDIVLHTGTQSPNNDQPFPRLVDYSYLFR